MGIMAHWDHWVLGVAAKMPFGFCINTKTHSVLRSIKSRRGPRMVLSIYIYNYIYISINIFQLSHFQFMSGSVCLDLLAELPSASSSLHIYGIDSPISPMIQNHDLPNLNMASFDSYVKSPEG